MNVTQLFQLLSYGELSNLSMSGEGSGVIVDAKKPLIIGLTNKALMQLYTRFLLLEREVIIQMSDAITKYQLSAEYSVNNPDPDPLTTLFIHDSVASPFTNDVLRILEVYDSTAQRVPLNDAGNPLSVFTPQIDVLQVPLPADGLRLYITYQAYHPVLAPDDFQAEITLPPPLTEALTSYIAHLVYSGMNGQLNTAKGAEYLTRYETICARVEQTDMVSSSVSGTSYKFQSRGWI